MPAAITPPAVSVKDMDLGIKDLSVPKTSMLETMKVELANKKRKIICFSGTCVDLLIFSIFATLAMRDPGPRDFCFQPQFYLTFI